MTSNVSAGKCEVCGRTFSKRGMSKHLETCIRRNEEAGVPGEAGSVEVLHLYVHAPYAPPFWLHLDVTAATTLEEIDGFLRDIWLEYCGHLSAFYVGEERYDSHPPGWDEDERGMDVAVGTVLSLGTTINYEYDFGSTTELDVQGVSNRWVRGTPCGVELLARNLPPAVLCGGCGAPATMVCTSCMTDGDPLLCDDCAEGHPCGIESLLPFVNSPRCGICGYTG